MSGNTPVSKNENGDATEQARSKESASFSTPRARSSPVNIQAAGADDKHHLIVEQEASISLDSGAVEVTTILDHEALEECLNEPKLDEFKSSHNVKPLQ